MQKEDRRTGERLEKKNKIKIISIGSKLGEHEVMSLVRYLFKLRTVENVPKFSMIAH